MCLHNIKNRKSRALNERPQGARCRQVGPPYPPSPFCNVRDRNAEASHSQWPSVGQVGYALLQVSAPAGMVWFQAPHMHEPHSVVAKFRSSLSCRTRTSSYWWSLSSLSVSLSPAVVKGSCHISPDQLCLQQLGKNPLCGCSRCCGL